MTDKFIPHYDADEGADIIIQDSLYPKHYSFLAPPRAPTAYSPSTFKKLMEVFMGNDKEKNEAFLRRNEQRISPKDLSTKARDEMLAMRSAALSEALEQGEKKGIRTGKNMGQVGGGEERYGEAMSDTGNFWASNQHYNPEMMSAFAHESLHPYLMALRGTDGVDAVQGMMLQDGDSHHALIDILNKRLTGIDDQYESKPYHAELLDAIERAAEKRIGAAISKKNQGRISSR